MPTDHVIDPAAIHHAWDRELPPALTIASGDSVAVDVPMAGHGQVPRDGAYADCAFDFDTLYHLAGPIAIEGAEPGHTLQVELLELIPGDWGWTVIMPDAGAAARPLPGGPPPDVRPDRRRDRRRAGRGGAGRPVLRHAGHRAGPAGPAVAVPAARGRREPGQPPSGRGVDAVAAGPRAAARCSRSGTRTPPRATARSASRPASARCAPRCASRCSRRRSPPRASGPLPGRAPAARRARHDGDRARPDGGRQDRASRP